MQNAITRIAGARSLRFTQARTDFPICVPMRESFLTGNSMMNHHMGPSFATTEYLECARLGRKKADILPGSPGATRWQGPWERDLAIQRQIAVGGWGTAGAVTTEPIAATSQGATAGASNSFRSSQYARADVDDDLQAFTGSLPNWLSYAGVTCGLIGKYQNKYGCENTSGYGKAGGTPAWVGSIFGGGYDNGTNYVFDATLNPNSVQSYVPPGWSVWHCLDGDPTATVWTGTTGNAYNYRVAHYEGANPGQGDGVAATSLTEHYYDKAVSSISRVGTVATVTCTGHGMTDVGEEFCIEGATPSAYNGTTWTVASIIDANTFTFTLPADPGANASGTLHCFPRRHYSESQWTRLGAAFINARAENEPWFLYYAPHNPHKGFDQYNSSGDPTRDAPTKEVEKRYAASIVALSDRMLWEGAPGVFAPTCDSSTEPVASQTEWQRRQQMMGSVDDTIGALLDACERRGWFNVTLILTSDNGWLQGEHTVSAVESEASSGNEPWSNGKGFIWEGCLRMPMWIRHPEWGRSGVSHIPITGADLPLTILDIFGGWTGLSSLLTHHAHTKRDGVSILRLVNSVPGDAIRDRALYGSGKWKQGADAESIITKDLKKLIRNAGDTTGISAVLYDMTQAEEGSPAGGVPGNPGVGHYLDYEQTDIRAANTALATTLNGRLNNLRVGRYVPASGTNTYRTA